MSQVAPTPKFVALHDALNEGQRTVGDKICTKRLAGKVIAAVRNCRLPSKFVVAYLRVPLDSPQDVSVKAMGELTHLPFHFWNRLELEHSWIFWAAPINLKED